MPAPENVDARARLLGYARWVAIGLASLAALIIAAFSGAAALRIAAFMAVIAVVLVVLSITLNGASTTKLHLEETLLDEIDMLREDVRADITTAARATHKALAERVAHLHENVEQVRRQAEERALGDARAARPAVSAPPPRRAIGGAGVPVVHTETVHVTTQTYVDPVDDPRAAGFVRPTTRRPERDDFAEPMRGDRGRPDMGRGDMGRGDMGRGDGGHPDMGRADGGRGDGNRISIPRDGIGRESGRGDPGRADFGADRIRGREPHAIEESGRRGRDDDAPAWHDRSEHDSPSSGRRPIRDPREDSWAEQRIRDLVAPHVADAPADSIGPGWRGGRDDDPADDDRWSAIRSGDRWAEVRTDEHGRELRMGERRTAVRADETGTQMRIVDRWSSVRQENVPYSDGYEPAGQHGSGGGHRGSDAAGWRSTSNDRDAAGRDSAFRGGDDNTGETRSERRRREEAERSRPALPASGPESAAGWVRGHADDGRADRRDDRDDHRGGSRAGLSRPERSPRDISGEVVRRPAAAPDPVSRRGDPAWSEPQRPAVEPRSARRSADTGGRAPEHYPADPRMPEPRPTDRRPAAPRPPDSRHVDGRRGDGRAADSHGGEDRWGNRPETSDAGRDRSGDVSRDERYGARPGHSGRDARDDNRWEREPSGGRSAVRRGLEFDDNDDRWR